LLSKLAAANGTAAAAAAAAAAGAEEKQEGQDDEPVPPALRGIPRDALELVLLGTVSAQPSSHRNVSAYYLDFFARGGALADCGECVCLFCVPFSCWMGHVLPCS
jgi:hypothetical protein